MLNFVFESLCRHILRSFCVPTFGVHAWRRWEFILIVLHLSSSKSKFKEHLRTKDERLDKGMDKGLDEQLDKNLYIALCLMLRSILCPILPTHLSTLRLTLRPLSDRLGCSPRGYFIISSSDNTNLHYLILVFY